MITGAPDSNSSWAGGVSAYLCKPMAIGWIVGEAMKSVVPLLPNAEGLLSDEDGGNLTPKIGTAH